MENPPANEPGEHPEPAAPVADHASLPAHDVPLTVDAAPVVAAPDPEPAPVVAVDPEPPAPEEHAAPEAEHTALAVVPETHHELAVVSEEHHELAVIPEHHAELAVAAPEPAPFVASDHHDSTPAAAIDPPLEAATEPAGAPPAEERAHAHAQPNADPAKPGVPRTLGIDPAVAERKRRAQEAWERVVAAKDSGAIVEGVVTSAVKGGFLVDVDGVRGFLPASQAAVPEGTTPEAFVKTKVPLKVLDVDVPRKRIVASHRRAADAARRANRSTAIRALAVGQRHEATVVRLAPFGAFVDIGNGIEGLVPMSELAFERVDKVEDVLAVGDKFPVSVLRIEDRGKKIAFSRKNALPDPWRDHADVVRVGATIEGKVVAKEPRLQVEIAPGVVGAVRESDADPNDYEIGEAVEVTIRTLDRRTRRIGLTTMAAAAAMPAATRSGFAPLGEELARRRT